MPLSNKDLADIAREFGVAKSEMSDDKSAIPNIQQQITEKEAQAKRVYILYNNAQLERVSPYEIEHRWLDGTTYTPITQQQIEDAGKRTPTNIFFPTSWTKSNAQLTTSGNGNPKTTSPNSEKAVLQAAVEDQGLMSQVTLLLNGQASGAPSRVLDNPYSPGNTILTFTLAHSFTIGRYLYISGSGTSALVKVTGTSTFTVNIQEVIQPAGTISAGGLAVENIAGFSNSERQTLTSGSYQRILTELTTRILSAAALYSTALNNQLAQLKINIDAPAQISAAKTSVETAILAYNTWFALPNTGVGGRWTDTPLTDFTNSYTTRNGGLAARAAQITTALGSVSQDAQGNYSGVGNYLQRFKSLNFLINSANGPLYAITGLEAAKTTFQQKVMNNADKLATFSNLVRYSGFTKDPVGSSAEAEGLNQFSNGDTVYLSANDLPSVQCTIISIVGNTVTLSIAIPAAYNKAAKGSIIKPV